jgi:hypothetical protein
VEQRRGVSVGSSTQLAVQQQTQLSIHQQRGGIVAGAGEVLHQPALGALAQGIGGHHAGQALLGSRRVPGRQVVIGQGLQGGQVGLLAHQALLQRPRLRAALQ